MMVDVVTYMFNFLAERLKHVGHVEVSARNLRLRRLYLELVPPLISVITLMAVTISALHNALNVLVLDRIASHASTSATDTSAPSPLQEEQPDLYIMFVFSGLNLILDFLNVGCFARVDQAVGLPGQVTRQSLQHSNDNPHAEPLDSAMNESTPLVSSHSHHHIPSSGMTNGNQIGLSEFVMDEATSEDSVDATGTLNLNMCSAWTHVCADTLRSVAVLVASGVAFVLPQWLSPRQADAGGAVIVSIIILVSLVPLMQGLYLTACKIRDIWFGVPENAPHHSHDLAKFYVS
jgi:Co/Zn/Cd efflux system component